MTLYAGTSYWIVAAAGAADTELAWNLNNQGYTGLWATEHPAGSWGYMFSPLGVGAFAVQGALEIPEPVGPLLISFALMGLGLAGKWPSRLRHDRQD